MDTNLNTPVVGGESQSAGTAPATVTGGAPQGGATTNPSNDEAVQKAVGEAIKKYEDDIRKLKSNSDKRDADRAREMAQREAEFNRKLKDLEMRGMDENARKKYEEEHKTEELQRLVREKQDYQRQLAEMQQRMDYEKFFAESGVPSSKLVTDQGIEALAESGWKAIKEQLKLLQEENQKLKSGQQGEVTLPDAPTTLNHNSKTPAKLSISDAAKKYAGGDEDRLYTMIEKGMLNPSVLNLSKE